MNGYGIRCQNATCSLSIATFGHPGRIVARLGKCGAWDQVWLKSPPQKPPVFVFVYRGFMMFYDHVSKENLAIWDPDIPDSRHAQRNLHKTHFQEGKQNEQLSTLPTGTCSVFFLCCKALCSTWRCEWSCGSVHFMKLRAKCPWVQRAPSIQQRSSLIITSLQRHVVKLQNVWARLKTSKSWYPQNCIEYELILKYKMLILFRKGAFYNI